jgi:signal transduction histidine kinase
MLAMIRLGSVGFIYIPLFGWDQLPRPGIALAVAVLATGYGLWFARRCWTRETTGDPVLVWSDVLVALVVMTVGSRASLPEERNVIMTELIPYSLVCSATLGFGIGWSARSIAAVGTLAGTWVLAIQPHITLKLWSDLLGFVVWYVVSLLVAGQLRSMARQTDLADAERVQVLRLAARRDLDALADRYRDLLQRVLHDEVIPLLDQVGDATPVTTRTRTAARRVARRSRDVLRSAHEPATDAGRSCPLPSPGTRLNEGLADVVHGAEGLGVTVDPVLRLRSDPPPEVITAVLSAVRESLNNVARHSGCTRATLYAEADEGELLVTVADDGCGVRQELLRPDGGLTRSTAPLRRLGGGCEVLTRPAGGTKVVITWENRRGCPRNDAPAGSAAPAVRTPSVPPRRTPCEQAGNHG